MSTENMNGTNGAADEKCAPDVGIAPGLNDDYVDPHLKAHREYESDYANLALKGGHKGLLSMSSDGEKISTTDEFGRRQKGCENISEYCKLAMQGGHKDLLKIEENGKSNGHTTPIKSKDKNPSTRTSGDWFADKNGVSDNNNTPTPVKTVKPTSPEPRTTTPIRDQRRSNGNCIVPGGEQEPPRFGKKRFNNMNQRQEAPFATNY